MQTAQLFLCPGHDSATAWHIYCSELYCKDRQEPRLSDRLYLPKGGGGGGGGVEHHAVAERSRKWNDECLYGLACALEVELDSKCKDQSAKMGGPN